MCVIHSILSRVKVSTLHLCFFNRKERHLSKSTPAIVLAVHEIFDGQDNGIYNEMVELSNEYWHLLYSMQKTVD